MGITDVFFPPFVPPPPRSNFNGKSPSWVCESARPDRHNHTAPLSKNLIVFLSLGATESSSADAAVEPPRKTWSSRREGDTKRKREV